MKFRLAYLAKVGIVAGVYFGAGVLGLSLAAMQKNVSVVWPPTGIALAALLLFGSRLWPGIWLGAFSVNASTGVSVATAAGIATGNTLEGLAGAFLLQRVSGFSNSLDRLRDVLGLIGLAAGCSTTISATIGVSSLLLGGVISWDRFGPLWWQWWLGDAMGALVVAPVLLTWGAQPRIERSFLQVAEAGACLAALIVFSGLVFGGWMATAIDLQVPPYFVFPPLIWAALRLGQRGTTAGILVVSGVAIWWTSQGFGPFAMTTLTEALSSLQIFMGVVAATGMVLAAAIAERQRAEAALRHSEDTYRDLVESSEDLLCTHDLEGRLLSVNRAVIRTLGYREPDDLLGRKVSDFLAPDTRHLFDAYLDTVRTEGQAQGFMKVVTPSGEHRILEYRNSLRSEGVAVPIVRGRSLDVTERVRAKEALRVSQERFRSLVQNAPICIHEIDAAGRITSMNPAGLKMMGVADESRVIGMRYLDAVSFADWPRVGGLLNRALAGESSEFEFVAAGEGEPRIFASSFIPLWSKKGTVEALMGVTQDITDRKHAEEALRDKTVQLGAITEAMMRFLESGDWREASAQLLRSALSQTASEYGFVGVVVEGRVLRILAHEGIVWDATVNREFYEEALRAYQAVGYLEFSNLDNLFGRVITSGQAVVANDPATDPRSGGRPPAHPPLRHFLGVPIHQGSEVVGMIGVANRPGGYSGAEQGKIEILTRAVGVLYDSYRRLEREARLEGERRQADETLTLFRSLVDHTNDAIEIIDAETGRFLDVNERACQAHGYTREEYLALSVSDIDPVVATLPWDQIREEVRSAGSRIYDTQHRRKDGSVFPVEVNCTYVRLERDYMLAVVRDVTDRKQAEATRRALYLASLEIQTPLELQDRLDRLLQTARDVLRLDRLNILLADPEGEWLEGVAALGTKEPAETVRVPIGPQGGGVAHAFLSQQPVIWLDSHAPVPEPIRLPPPYNQLETFRSRAFVLLPLVVEGRAIGVLGADRKHTRQPLDAETLELLQLFAALAALAVEHGRLYDKQRIAARELEAEVEARTRELQAANRRLEAASHHKSEFLANMSHELRTPLNSILGFSQLLGSGAIGPLTDKQSRYVQHILTSGHHLLALINDLLDLSKVEAGKLDLRIESFDLTEALAAALSEVGADAKAKGLHLRQQVDPTLFVVVADPVRFKQVVLNLLSNAVKFTPPGGSITVIARAVHSSQLTVNCPRRVDSEPSTVDREPFADFVEISVEDTGIGIRADDLPKLFRPFTQLESPFAKRHEGTGLGLALAKQLVELHGGTIWAQSAGEGRGSTFTVRLPLVRTESEGGSPRSAHLSALRGTDI